MNIEATWYEGSPYVYAGVGVASLSNYGSYLAIASGVVLLVASATIIRMRRIYRKLQAQKREQEERWERALERNTIRRNSIIVVDDEL